MESICIIADSKSEGFDFSKKVYEKLKLISNNEFSIDLINIERTTFKDKEFKIRISKNIRRKKCFVIHDPNKEPCKWLTELIFILEAIKFSSAEEINVILPYTRYTRQDRKDESRVSVNIKAFADIISLYATRGVTCDLHAEQIKEYFSIPFDNLYSFPVLIKHLREKHPELLKNLAIVSPDLGGGKRVELLAKKLSTYGIKASVAFGHKTREEVNEVSKIVIIGNIKNKNCLIVDDIIDTGNTLVRTGEILKEKGAKSVFAYGTHGLFTDGFEKFKVFDKVFISDSLNPKIKDKHDNLEKISLVDLFAEAIYRTIIGKSLNVLFE